MIQPEKEGPQAWTGVHETYQTTVDEIYNIDNVGSNGMLRTGWPMFRQAGEDLNALIREAQTAGKRLLPIGSGWALSRINITDSWLLNTKQLNGCYDVSDEYLHAGYPAEKRRNLVLVQAGMQIAELNTYLELLPLEDESRRALPAAGIGNGQTVAGAVSGNTHGSQLTYGAMPDFVVGLHLATGGDRTLWIERHTKPVMTDEFVEKLGAQLIRDDAVFNAAIVSIGAFGVIAALAVETAPIYQLEFPPIVEITHAELEQKLARFAAGDIPNDLYHYEFIFDPFSHKQKVLEACAPKVPYKPGVPTPKPRWILRNKDGQAPGNNVLRFLRPFIRLVPPGVLSAWGYGWYRRFALLGDVRGSPGQLYTASVYYLKGYIESAFAVSVKDVAATIKIASEITQEVGLPSIYQVRLCRASAGTLSFTQHEPITAVFELGMIHDERFPQFERRLDEEFRKANIRYTLHWSKNSGISPEKLKYMYGDDKISSWKAARSTVFGGDAKLMKLFETDVMVETGLA